MISVVVAAYCGEKYILEQLESIRNQTVKPDEVLIFDDGSNDNTVAIVSDFIEKNDLDWKLYLNETNKGYSKNFLDGINMAKGDIIFMADQDDIWKPEKIEEMVRVMRENEDIKALCCSCGLIDGCGKPMENPGNLGVLFDRDDGSIEAFSPKRFIGRSFIRGCSVCFRSSVKPYLASIELKGLLSHDWLVTFTAALTGRCCVYNKILMDYRCHGENNSFGKREKSGKALLQNRTDAIKYSAAGHEYVLNNADAYEFMTDCLKTQLKKQVDFENKRVDYLQNGGFVRFVKCFFNLGRYRCYYGNFKGAVRVFGGDVLYRKNAK